ncbi:hypothetical protein [Thiocapsa sp.]|uniref:hypothetical protein n=1 Tax=Thiocapsa sp. TaxID=2024551 RepID=UPI0025DD210D|nr:hypothetical protein [Thiocapsa sp.]
MDRDIALIVVHGIGSQRSGETIGQCVGGILHRCPLIELKTESGQALTVREMVEQGLTRATLHTVEQTVRVYEVAWADLLAGEQVSGTFNKVWLAETSWYPWLNAKCGWLTTEEYPRWLVIARTLQLVFVQLVFTPIYELLPQRWHAEVMDQVVADVSNYMHSFTGWVKPLSPLRDAADRIIDRFRDVAAQAAADGCSEIQIVAHSLGTVIAYQGLGYYSASAPSGGQAVPITHLYTLGSPLEKVLFIWSGSLRPELAIPQIQRHDQALAEGKQLRWRNYHSPLDLVSGYLRRFKSWGPVENIRLRDLGNLAKAHTAYFRHPRFQEDLSLGLGLPQRTAEPSRTVSLVDKARSAVVNLTLPVFLLLASLLGTILVVAVLTLVVVLSWSLAYLIVNYPLNALLSLFGLNVSFGAVAQAAVVVGLGLTLPLLMYFTVVDGYRYARRTHDHWQRSKAESASGVADSA